MSTKTFSIWTDMHKKLWTYSIDSIEEYKYFLFFISKINIFDKNFKKTSFNIQDFNEYFKINRKSDNSTIKQICSTFKNWINWKLFLNEKISYAGKIDIFEYLKYENAVITYKINNHLSRFFLEPWLNYENDFVRMLTFPHFNFNHKLSEFIYINLRITRADIQIDIETLRKNALKNDTYKKYSHFKEKILIPSINDINKKSDIRLTFKEIKQQQKVVIINLIFSWNNKIDSYDPYIWQTIKERFKD